MGKGSFSFSTIGNSVQVGNYCSIATGCYFFETYDQHLAADNHKMVFTTNWNNATNKVKPIIIGHDVWIGRNAIIFNGVHIGNGAIIGTGAVITKDVPAFAVMVGNPAKMHRLRFTPEQILKLEKIKWWDWDKPIIDQRLSDFYDIDVFLQKYYKEE